MTDDDVKRSSVRPSDVANRLDRMCWARFLFYSYHMSLSIFFSIALFSFILSCCLPSLRWLPSFCAGLVSCFVEMRFTSVWSVATYTLRAASLPAGGRRSLYFCVRSKWLYANESRRISDQSTHGFGIVE
jgi:hypothetical protein